MKRFLYILAAACAFTLAPHQAQAKLTPEQEASLRQIITPLFAVRADLKKAGELLLQVRDGRTSATDATPELKRLLDTIAANRNAYMEQNKPSDEEVSKFVNKWLMWNRDKLEISTQVLVQLSTQLLNTPGTDPALIEVLKNSFFGEDLRHLSEFPADELAKVEPTRKQLRECADCMNECIRLLESITNKEEAEAAIPQIRKLLALYKTLNKSLKAAQPSTDIQRQILQTTSYTCGFPALNMELSDAITIMIFDKKCFGSKELNKALHF